MVSLGFDSYVALREVYQNGLQLADLAEPFVGDAGQLLTKMIAAMGWSRHDVYINNIVSCRPPGNRTPTPEEAASFRAWLIEAAQEVGSKDVMLYGQEVNGGTHALAKTPAVPTITLRPPSATPPSEISPAFGPCDREREIR